MKYLMKSRTSKYMSSLKLDRHSNSLGSDRQETKLKIRPVEKLRMKLCPELGRITVRRDAFGADHDGVRSE